LHKQSPDKKPYLSGKSYYPLLYLWIPRFLWKNKPAGHEANTLIVIYYGIQTEKGAARTSIGVGIIGEAYANYGWKGVIILSIILGFLLAEVQYWSKNSNALSMRSFIAAPFCVTVINIEAPIASTLVPLFQSLVVIVIVFAFLTIKRRWTLHSSMQGV